MPTFAAYCRFLLSLVCNSLHQQNNNYIATLQFSVFQKVRSRAKATPQILFHVETSRPPRPLQLISWPRYHTFLSRNSHSSTLARRKQWYNARAWNISKMTQACRCVKFDWIRKNNFVQQKLWSFLGYSGNSWRLPGQGQKAVIFGIGWGDDNALNPSSCNHVMNPQTCIMQAWCGMTRIPCQTGALVGLKWRGDWKA